MRSTTLRTRTRRVAVATMCLAMLVAGTAQAKTYEIKFGTVAPEGTPWTEQLNRIKKRVEKESEGRIKFKLFPGAAIGGEIEMVRMLRRGRIQGFGGSLTAIAEGASIPQLNVVELPYLFSSYAEADHVLDEVIFDDLSGLLAGKGFKLAQWHENGWRNFAGSVQVTKPEDLQPLKMRAQESPIHLAMYEALGVQAESIPTPEVLSALQTGLVDGFDNTPLFSSATGWYEGVKHYTVSEHIYQPAAILYNQKFWDGLPEDLQAIVLGDWQEETRVGRENVRAIQEVLLQNFRDAGLEVHSMTDEQKAVFQERTRSVHEKFAPEIGRPLLDKIYKALEAYRAAEGGTP